MHMCVRKLSSLLAAALAACVFSPTHAADPGASSRFMWSCTINPKGRDLSLGHRATVRGVTAYLDEVTNYRDVAGADNQRFVFAWHDGVSNGWFIQPEHKALCIKPVNTTKDVTSKLKAQTCSANAYWFLAARGGGHFSISYYKDFSNSWWVGAANQDYQAYYATEFQSNNDSFLFQIRDCISLSGAYITPAPM